MVAKQRLSYKYRLYPTWVQKNFLDNQLREACDLYNCALQERRDAWKTCRMPINFYDQDAQLKPLRAEGLIGIPNFSCARDVLRRVDLAFRAFFRRCKRGENPGYPRFRSARRYDSITFPMRNGWKLMPSGRLRVQGAGQIKIKLHRQIDGEIAAVTLKREAGRWYACFTVERAPYPLPATTDAVGIDVGINHLAVLSDGATIDNPRYCQMSQARLRCARRKVSRRAKWSNRRRKAVLLLRRATVHVRNQRADFQHKLSRQLVNRYGVIVVEDLNVKGLSRGMLAKAISDAGWAQFIRKLTYKAECAGRRVVKVDARGTSQTCTCGATVPKRLKDRWHNCPKCGLSASRDHVSAQVILQRARIEPSGLNVEEVVSCVS